MFRPMWSSLGVNIIGRGNCCFLLLLMLFIYKSFQCACAFENKTQHNTQQERTQPTNSNTHAHRKDLYIVTCIAMKRLGKHISCNTVNYRTSVTRFLIYVV
jgi:hypothetical protein